MSQENKNTFAATVDAIQKLGESLIPAGFEIVEIESVKTDYDGGAVPAVFLTVQLRAGVNGTTAPASGGREA